MMDNLYPVAVFSTRYGGTYEGAPWVAVKTHVDPGMSGAILSTVDLEDCQSDDVSCMMWFDDSSKVIGRGDSPDEAVADLARKLGVDWQPGDDGMMNRFKRALKEAETEAKAKAGDDE